MNMKIHRKKTHFSKTQLYKQKGSNWTRKFNTNSTQFQNTLSIENTHPFEGQKRTEGSLVGKSNPIKQKRTNFYWKNNERKSILPKNSIFNEGCEFCNNVLSWCWFPWKDGSFWKRIFIKRILRTHKFLVFVEFLSGWLPGIFWILVFMEILSFVLKI